MLIPQEKYRKVTKFMAYVHEKKIELATALKELPPLGTTEYDQMKRTQLLDHFEELLDTK